MRRCIIAAFWLTSCAVAPAAEHRCEFAEVPDQVVERQTFTVKISYTVPEGQRVTLRGELKNPQHIVLQGERAEVAGQGVQEFTFTAPELAAAREILIAAWMGENWRRSLCPIVHTSPIRIVTAAEARRLAAMRREADELRTKLASARTEQGHIGIYQFPSEDWPADLAASLAEQLRAEGYGVSVVEAGVAGNPHVLTPDLFDLLILADVRVMPATAARALERYSGSGGKLMTLGAPAFDRALWPLNGEWLETADYRDAIAAKVATQVWQRFEENAGGEWRRSSNRTAADSAVSHAAGGALDSKGCVRFDVPELTGWETFQAPFEPRFPEGHTWTTFWAKGGDATSQLAIEWREKDGSRWIATVPLTARWRPYALPPAAFRYWQDSASEDRGGPGDSFHPENAGSITFGLAFTHTTGIGRGPHRFWIDNVGSGVPPKGVDPALLLGEESHVPRLETISPGYKTYPVTNLAKLRTSPAQVIAPALEAALPAGLRSPHPRPQSTCIGKNRRWRYVPLVECLDARDRTVGAAASLVITGADPSQGGVTVGVPVSDPAFFAARQTREWLAGLAARIVDGVFLYEGGARYYASFGGEAMPVGATVTNRGREKANVAVRVTVREGDREVWGQSFEQLVEPGAAATVAAEWTIPADARGPYDVAVRLLRDGREIDRLDHQVRIWRPKPEAERTYLVARDGDFYDGDQKWYAHGVNYMPSSGIGIEDRDYFEYWLDPQPYDPDVIERDLTDCEAIGFNMVSVFVYYRSLESRNLLDLLMRCEDHGLKVNLSLRPGTPMDFRWDEMRQIVTALRLAENDNIIAYDLAWEPHWRGRDQRRRYDRQWETWVVKTYGSIEAAEAAWGVKAPRQDGKFSNPTDRQVAEDGAWRRMVLDYRRWQDEILGERYAKARELMRSIDPHHLVSFRMSMAGDPTANPRAMFYDFAGLADAVDLLEPEGYGRIGDWERVKPGWFTVAYGRAVAPGLPIMWAEFGNTVWNRATGRPDPDRLAFTAQFYDDFYTMAYRSGANGTVCWWFPGGYRWNEKSDFGILNPDRSWREVTRVINRWAEKMTAPRDIPQPDVWIEFSRTKRCDGLWGIYREAQEAFWKAIEEGHTPGLREVR